MGASREDVWLALSELWLDNQLQDSSHRHIARVLLASGLPVEELRLIYLEGEPAEFGKNRTLRISRTFRSRGVIGGRQGRGERLLHQGGKRGAVLGAKYPGRLQLQQAPMQHTLPPDAQVRVRFLHREGQDRAQLSQLVRLQSVRGFTWAHKGRVP